MLRTRVLTALVMGPVVFLLLYFGGIPWVVLIALASVLAWREMDQLVRRDHYAVDRLLGLLFVLGAVLEAFARARGLIHTDLLRPLLALLLILSLTWALYSRNEDPTAYWGLTVATALYLGVLLSHFIILRERPDGFRWAGLAVGLTWIVDATAYFTGSALGKHKLWPRISPKKTWEGLIGGTLSALIAGPLLGGWLAGLNWGQGLLLGALVAAADPFGDFVVSLFKRLAHMKDSSNLIPGHGGVLDRLDSLLFTIPVATYFAWLITGR